ncbi:MAG: esterase family protein [Bacteroidetes bacterium]|nr:esterase family protein [Bacteroidota bacterium]
MSVLRKVSFLIIFILFVSFYSFAAIVDTVSIQSNVMQVAKKCVVIKPYSYQNKNNRYPVVYLLHGYSGNYANWISKVPELKNYADEFQLMIVCPDGNFNSWYVDSKLDNNSKYETYISTEVVHFIDSAYNTLPLKKYRAIAGLSMGGHGALYLALKHPDNFVAAGSMSGVLDLQPFKNKYEILKYMDSSEIENYSVVTLLKDLKAGTLALVIDCGVDDPFIETAREAHHILLNKKIAHDFIERDGGHNWKYWSNAISYQLMFFTKSFRD